jgi:hypothetical protein
MPNIFQKLIQPLCPHNDVTIYEWSDFDFTPENVYGTVVHVCKLCKKTMICEDLRSMAGTKYDR